MERQPFLSVQHTGISFLMLSLEACQRERALALSGRALDRGCPQEGTTLETLKDKGQTLCRLFPPFPAAPTGIASLALGVCLHASYDFPACLPLILFPPWSQAPMAQRPSPWHAWPTLSDQEGSPF